MARDSAQRVPIGRTALGGAACGFTYDAAMLDAVAREKGMRRRLRVGRWQAAPRVADAAAVPFSDTARELAEAAPRDPQT